VDKEEEEEEMMGEGLIGWPSSRGGDSKALLCTNRGFMMGKKKDLI